MKKKEKQETSHDLPELEIIDLDKESPDPLKTEEKKPVKKAPVTREIPTEETPAEEELPMEETPAEAKTPIEAKAPIKAKAPMKTKTFTETEASMKTKTSTETEASMITKTSTETEASMITKTSTETEASTKEDIPAKEDVPTEEEAWEEPEGFFNRVNWHALFAVCVVLTFALIFWRILNFGTRLNLEDYGYEERPDVMDSIVPLLLSEEQKPVDDGVTTIVALGNAPFADDRDSEDSLAHIIEDMSGAVVYNCSVSGSYLAAQADSISYNPMDAFNFYWLVYAACGQEGENLRRVYREAFEKLGDTIPPDGIESYNTLMSIDYSTVDVIVIMYDGSDYLAGHEMYSDDNFTDIYQFTGNMAAGIKQLQSSYPHIRIIVMSPCFAYAVNEKGDYVSSETYRYGQDTLSTYVIKQAEAAYRCRVSFVDDLYGTVTEGNASKYLKDNIHLNVEGRKLVAERFLYALNYFNTPAESSEETASGETASEETAATEGE